MFLASNHIQIISSLYFDLQIISQTLSPQTPQQNKKIVETVMVKSEPQIKRKKLQMEDIDHEFEVRFISFHLITLYYI